MRHIQSWGQTILACYCLLARFCIQTAAQDFAALLHIQISPWLYRQQVEWEEDEVWSSCEAVPGTKWRDGSGAGDAAAARAIVLTRGFETLVKRHAATLKKKYETASGHATAEEEQRCCPYVDKPDHAPIAASLLGDTHETAVTLVWRRPPADLCWFVLLLWSLSETVASTRSSKAKILNLKQRYCSFMDNGHKRIVRVMVAKYMPLPWEPRCSCEDVLRLTSQSALQPE